MGLFSGQVPLATFSPPQVRRILVARIKLRQKTKQCLDY